VVLPDLQLFLPFIILFGELGEVEHLAVELVVVVCLFENE
jgi:hypothetical protein